MKFPKTNNAFDAPDDCFVLEVNKAKAPNRVFFCMSRVTDNLLKSMFEETLYTSKIFKA